MDDEVPTTLDENLPAEVFDADPDGKPEQTANAAHADDDGPEGEVEDA